MSITCKHTTRPDLTECGKCIQEDFDMSGCHVPLSTEDVKERELELENEILKQQKERLKEIINYILIKL